MSANQSCTDCGADLEAVPDGQPCPHCGSHSRSVLLTAAVAVGVAVSATPTVSVEYNPVGSWMDQWRRMMRHLDEIRTLYARTGGVDDLTNAVQQFFVACWHLSDYICKDKVYLPSFDENHVWAYKNADAHLPIAQALANTLKHLERRNPADPVARVKRTSIGPPGNFAIVSYEAPPLLEVELDALKLAEDCVATWERFLAIEGITPPS